MLYLPFIYDKYTLIITLRDIGLPDESQSIPQATLVTFAFIAFWVR